MKALVALFVVVCVCIAASGVFAGNTAKHNFQSSLDRVNAVEASLK